MNEIIWRGEDNNVPDDKASADYAHADDALLQSLQDDGMLDEPVITAEDVAKDLAYCRMDIADHQEAYAKMQAILEESHLWKDMQERKKMIASLKEEAATLETTLRELTVQESKATKYAVKKFEWGEVKKFEGKDVVEITDVPAALQWAVVNAPNHISLAPTFNDAIIGLELPFAQKHHTEDEYKLSIKKDLSGILPKEG